MDKLPYLKKLIEDWKLEPDIANISSLEGKNYFLPYVYERALPGTCFIVRGDVLAATGLKQVTNIDELFEFLKKAKELQKDSVGFSSVNLNTA